ncbi:ABC transporter permease subunit, partial [Vibrio parahaemolyticus]
LQLEIFAQHISLVHLLLLLFTPVLTMRLLAEEKKLRTYDLLLTSPITATQIALGKFLAGLLSALTLVAISFL